MYVYMYINIYIYILHNVSNGVEHKKTLKNKETAGQKGRQSNYLLIYKRELAVSGRALVNQTGCRNKDVKKTI